MPGKRDNPYGIPGEGPSGDVPAGDGSIFEPLDGPPEKSIYEPLDGSAPAWPPFRPGGPAGGAAAPERGATGPAPPGPSGRAATPGQTFVLAGWGNRLAAIIIDNVVTLALLLCITVPAGVALGLTVPEAAAYFTLLDQRLSTISDPRPLQAVLGAQLIAQPLVIAWFLKNWKGQTPGKRLMRIRVVRADGGNIDWGTAVMRELLVKTVLVGLFSVITLFAAFLLNYLMPLWDKERRAGHDVIAKTRVVVADRP